MSDPKHPFLAATAYLLVPGERRKKAAGHFKKAGFEALKGINALAKPGASQGDSPDRSNERKNIRID